MANIVLIYKMKKKKSIKELFKRVKLLVLDVDGVLTKGELIYDDTGRELKAFNVKDGLGVHFLNKLGVSTVLLSGRSSPILGKRAKDMDVSEVIAGFLPKEAALESIVKKYSVKSEDICFVGDDLIDLELMKRVGVGVAVRDAVADVRRAAAYVTKAKGGQGAVREVIDLIIQHKGLRNMLFSCLKKPSIKKASKG